MSDAGTAAPATPAAPAAPAAPTNPAAGTVAPANPASPAAPGTPGAQSTTPAGQPGTPGAESKVAAWRESLYSEIKGLPEAEQQKARTWIDRYTTGGDFMKAQMTLRDSMDKKIALPKDDAKPEEWHELYMKLGKPEKVDGYKLTYPEGYKPEAWEGEAEKSFFIAAHEADLTQKQVQKLYNWNQQQRALQVDAATRSMNKYRADAETELRKEWGPDFDNNLAAANAAINEGFGDSFKAFGELKIEGSNQRIADHPMFARAMAKFGRSYGEDMKANGIQGADARGSLDEKIAEIQREALSKGKLPSDPEYHTRLQPLYEARHGTRKMSPTGPMARAR